MKVVVLGAGAVGSYYAGLLAKAAHEVTCFARGANLAAIRERGIEIRTPEGAFRVDVTATDDPSALPPADLALLTVKSFSLAEIAPVARQCASQGTALVPLLNGVETVEHLVQLSVPAMAILAGVTTLSVVRMAPGVVERRSAFQIVVVGEMDGRRSPRVDAITAAFGGAGVDARASSDIRGELWRKFAFVAGLAAACGLARSPIGPLREQPLGRRLLRRAVEEVALVARSRGITLAEADVARVLDVIEGLPAGMTPSFLTDLESGGRTELDVLSGAVSRFGEQAGLPTPIHDTATAALMPGPASEVRPS